MDGWIRQALAADQLGMAVIPAAFLIGLVGALSSCCTLPVFGAVAGYAGTLDKRSGRRELLITGGCFLLGTVVAMAALGAASGLVGRLGAASLGRYWRFVAGLFMVAFGLSGLGLLDLRLPGRGPSVRPPGQGVVGSIVYGLVVGGATSVCSVCCNPLLAMAAGAAVVQGAPVLGALVLASFALGYGLPLAGALVGLGLGLGRLRHSVQRLGQAVSAGLGVLLVVLGFYLLATV